MTIVPILSPCTSVCRIGPDDLCIGCRRTLDEIVQWPAMSDAARAAAMAEIALRPAATEADSDPSLWLR